MDRVNMQVEQSGKANRPVGEGAADPLEVRLAVPAPLEDRFASFLGLTSSLSIDDFEAAFDFPETARFFFFLAGR